MVSFKFTPFHDDDGTLENYQMLITQEDKTLAINIPIDCLVDITSFAVEITIREN